ncbi:MAG: alpha/beta fold hydrolase [Aeromonas hydrophila]
MSPRFTEWTQALQLGEVRLDIAAIGRPGTRAPVVFLHGFGSTKEDYADLVHHPDFDDRPFLAWDAPGCGATTLDRPDRIDLDLLVLTALKMIESKGFGRFHLVGHSMGGLTALLLAYRHPERVLSFTSMEGNLAPEDCFLYGEQNAHLSYLGALSQAGVRLTEIPRCGHFPMYSNPVLMWWALAEFFEESERYMAAG